MKTLILATSGQFVDYDDISNFLPKKITDCKIAYITTAVKKAIGKEFAIRHRRKMDELKFSYGEIELEGKNEGELEKTLSRYDIIMVEGDNTFYLLKMVRESGFEKVIKKLIEKGIVYIGLSAGAYIACPSIVMATWSTRGVDRCGVTDFTAMSLVPFLIKAHFTPDKLEVLKEKAKDLRYPLHLLNDKQAIVAKNKKIHFLGGGEEIVL